MQYAVLLLHWFCLLTIVDSARIIPSMNRPLTGRDPWNSVRRPSSTDPTTIPPIDAVPSEVTKGPFGVQKTSEEPIHKRVRRTRNAGQQLTSTDTTDEDGQEVPFETPVETALPKREYDPSKSPYKKVRSSLRWRPNNLQPMGQIFKKYQPHSQ